MRLASIIQNRRLVQKSSNVPHSHGTRYLPDIHIDRLSIENVSATFAKRAFQGRKEFYLPYTLSELNLDGHVHQGKFTLNKENSEILDYIKTRNILYTLCPSIYLRRISDKYELSEDLPLLKWVEKFHPDKVNFTNPFIVSYNIANIWIEFTENTRLD